MFQDMISMCLFFYYVSFAHTIFLLFLYKNVYLFQTDILSAQMHWILYSDPYP